MTTSKKTQQKAAQARPITTKTATTKKKKKAQKKRIPYYVCPEKMTLEEWQIALRRQMAQDEKYTISCVDEKELPGEYTVENPKTRQQYKVVYRGAKSPWNYCSCMDFKTSRLGTCKHIEAVKMWIRAKKQKVRQEIPAYTSVYLDYKAGRQVRIRIGSEHHDEYERLAKDFFDKDGVLQERAYRSIQRFIREAKAIDDNFRFYQDALDYIIEQRELAEREHIISRYTDDDLDRLLHVTLYPYQKEGVRFAFAKGKSIIADEMGLGKTIQAIATAELLRKERLATSILILCPTSLKYQWKREIERFTDAEAHVIEGSHLKRREQYNAPQPYKIISYNSACNDIKILGSLQTDVLIMDEVQRLKNWNTQISMTARRIRSDYSVILSGTPLENKLEELYSVMEFADQYCLGPYYQFRAECIETDDLGKIIGYKNLNRIGEQIRQRLIRRRKKDVALQMPERQDQNLLLTITQEQMDMHTEFKFQLSLLLKKWTDHHYLSEKDHLRVLQLLSQMRMVCDSSYILDQKTRYDTKVDEVMNIIQNLVDSGDEKVVVFSQWERMTRLVARELEKRDIGFEYLHGGIPSAKRKDLVNNFWDVSESRVFLSTDAGSTGLNLQVASTIINLDLPWNPAVLEQRIARIYRLGQKRNIQVVNLVAKDTIEEQMIGKLRFKTSMFEGVLDGGEDAVFVGNSSKFKEMMDNLAEVMDESKQTKAEETPAVTTDQEEAKAPVEQPQTSKDNDNGNGNGNDNENDNINDYATEKGTTEGTPAHKRPNDQSPKRPNDQSPKRPNDQSPKDLVAQGVSFLSGLVQTLKSPEATEELLSNIVEQDEATGQTSLKIPVPDKQTVRNLLDIVGKLFG